jgi:hypothetical protein
LQGKDEKSSILCVRLIRIKTAWFRHWIGPGWLAFGPSTSTRFPSLLGSLQAYFCYCSSLPCSSPGDAVTSSDSGKKRSVRN